MAVGLSYWQSMQMIILPQALKIVIPGIVNTFIGLFKDTTLVSIIGLLDFLGMINLSHSDSNWATPVQALTSYLFCAIIFFIFCFAMGRYSIFMEKRLDTGHR
jgi:general L-amino acid transport system permease protein